MEGGDEGRADARGEDEVLDPAPHLSRRLVGEGDGEYVTRVDAFDPEQPGDAMRDDARLAAARPREHEHGSLGGLHGLTLDGVERAEDGVGGDGGAQHRFVRYHSGGREGPAALATRR
jgi:hypothetical protein